VCASNDAKAQTHTFFRSSIWLIAFTWSVIVCHIEYMLSFKWLLVWREYQMMLMWSDFDGILFDHTWIIDEIISRWASSRRLKSFKLKLHQFKAVMLLKLTGSSSKFRFNSPSREEWEYRHCDLLVHYFFFFALFSLSALCIASLISLTKQHHAFPIRLDITKL
jgi:hypothetical protein